MIQKENESQAQALLDFLILNNSKARTSWKIYGGDKKENFQPEGNFFKNHAIPFNPLSTEEKTLEISNWIVP